MKAFRVYYDEEQKKFSVDYEKKEVEVTTQDDTESWFHRVDHAELGAAEMNKHFIDRVHKCKECGKTFIFSIEQEEWFKERNLTTPKRCIKCRKARKRAADTPSLKDVEILPY